MGRPLPGMELRIEDGELIVDPAGVPTFFLGYLGESVRRRGGEWLIDDRRDGGPWHTGDRVSADEDGWLHFIGRSDDVIVSAGYRIGPFEVESALVSHPAVAEAAAVAAPDEERGAVVRAVVVLRDPERRPSPELVRELQDHVKRETAPYKYPRIIDFADELPKTASGKVRRAELERGRLEGDDRVDLDLGALREPGDLNRHPRGRVLREERPVDLVDVGESGEVRHVDGQPDRAGERGAGGLAHRTEVLKAPTGLFGRALADDLAAGGIERYLP